MVTFDRVADTTCNSPSSDSAITGPDEVALVVVDGVVVEVAVCVAVVKDVTVEVIVTVEDIV
jgi:hypothetical protein